jgi:hypothetical protein
VVRGLSEYEQRIVDFVESDGCFVTGVFDPDGVTPNFAYSVGFPATLGQPDTLISGLDLELMHGLINDLHGLCRDGLRLDDFARTDRLLASFDCVFREVSPDRLIAEYWNSAIWYQESHRRDKFRSAIQVVWPDDGGRFPWEAGFDEISGGGQLSLWERGAVH